LWFLVLAEVWVFDSVDTDLKVRLDRDVRDTRVARLDGVLLQVLSIRTIGLGTGIDLCFRVDPTRRTVVSDRT